MQSISPKTNHFYQLFCRMIHSKEAYDIDIKQLMHEIEYKIQIKDLKKKLEISGEEYFGNIKINYD